MNVQNALNTFRQGQDLNRVAMASVMQEIMTGQAEDADIADFLLALKDKGETIEEISAAAEVIRGLALTVDIAGPHLVDIVGTGGDH